MIELTFELYLANKKLLAGSEEDMEVGISNIMNTNITDTGIIVLGKSLNGLKRISFFQKTKQLQEKCKPWSDLFKDIKKKGMGITEIDRKIIEYEIAELYLNTINDGKEKFIKNIKLELAW
tara:strand:+ start:1050 stop:1412 length:363 start_codon:yes stop_codon:yes gene_type:complete